MTDGVSTDIERAFVVIDATLSLAADAATKNKLDEAIGYIVSAMRMQNIVDRAMLIGDGTLPRDVLQAVIEAEDKAKEPRAP